MRCNGSNWAVYSPGSWDGFRNDAWALWAGVIMRLEHHLVGGYVRYISPHIIIIIKVCLSRKNLLGSKRIRPITCILHLYITHLYMYMGYAKGANGQCALFKMRFLLHFTCTQFSSTLLNVFGPVVQCTTIFIQFLNVLSNCIRIGRCGRYVVFILSYLVFIIEPARPSSNGRVLYF